MDSNQFIKDFVEIFDDEPKDSITLNTEFRDIEGWSSLTALSFMAMADNKYNIKIKGEEIRNSRTIEDLLNHVKSKI